MNKSMKWGNWGLAVLAFLASIAVQFIAAFIVILPTSFMIGIQMGMEGITDPKQVEQMTMEAMNDVLPTTIVVTHLLLLVTFSMWYYFGCGRPSLKKVPFARIFCPKYFIAMLLIAVGFNVFTNYGLSLIFPLIPESIVKNYEAMMEQAGFGESILAAISAVLIAPFGEEFIYRGVVFSYTKKAVSGMRNRRRAFWIANCVQALLFGVFHLNIIQGAYAFCLGLVLGYLAYRFDSILPAIFGHMIFNGFSTLAIEPISVMIPESTLSYAIVVVISAVVAIGGFVLAGPKKENI